MNVGKLQIKHTCCLTARRPVRMQAAANFAANQSPQLQRDAENCSWPRSCAWPREQKEDATEQPSGVLGALSAWFGLSKEDTSLPVEVEQLALFADDDATAHEHASGWWARIWRYQGPGL